MSNPASLQFSLLPLEPAVARSATPFAEQPGAGAFDDHLRRAQQPPEPPRSASSAPQRPEPRPDATSSTPSRDEEEPKEQSADENAVATSPAPPASSEPKEDVPPPADEEAAAADADAAESPAPTSDSADAKPTAEQRPAVETAPTTGRSEVVSKTEKATAEAIKNVAAEGEPAETASDNTTANEVEAEAASEQSEAAPEQSKGEKVRPGAQVVANRPASTATDAKAATPPIQSSTQNGNATTVKGDVEAASAPAEVATAKETPVGEPAPRPTGSSDAQLAAEKAHAKASTETPSDASEQGSDESAQREKPQPDEPGQRRPNTPGQPVQGTGREAQGFQPVAAAEAPVTAASNPVSATTTVTTLPETTIPASDLPAAESATPVANQAATTSALVDSTLDANGELLAERVARSVEENTAKADVRSGSSNGLTEAERLRLIQRVTRAFHTIGDQGGQLRLRLSPPELGSVRVDITVRNGVLSAHLEAETGAARDVLLENVGTLRERLAEQNIKLDHFDVDLAKHSSRQSTDQQMHDGHSPGDHLQGRPSREASDEQASAVDTTTRWAAPWLEGDRLDIVI